MGGTDSVEQRSIGNGRTNAYNPVIVFEFNRRK
jgi:hypothetical protein